MLRHPRSGVGLDGEALLSELLCSGVSHAIACPDCSAAYCLRGLFYGAPPPQNRHGVGSGLTSAVRWAHRLWGGGDGPELRDSIWSSAAVLRQPLFVLDRLWFGAPASHPRPPAARIAAPWLMCDPFVRATLLRPGCARPPDGELNRPAPHAAATSLGSWRGVSRVQQIVARRDRVRPHA